MMLLEIVLVRSLTTEKGSKQMGIKLSEYRALYALCKETRAALDDYATKHYQTTNINTLVEGFDDDETLTAQQRKGLLIFDQFEAHFLLLGSYLKVIDSLELACEANAHWEMTYSLPYTDPHISEQERDSYRHKQLALFCADVSSYAEAANKAVYDHPYAQKLFDQTAVFEQSVREFLKDGSNMLVTILAEK